MHVRKYFLKTRRGIVSAENQPCEDEVGFSEKKKRLPYFSRIPFFRLSSLRPFPRKLRYSPGEGSL